MAIRAALSDPTTRVYSLFTDLPVSLQSRYLRQYVLPEAIRGYKEGGMTEAAMILRRAWALPDALSWRFLCYVSTRISGHTGVLADHILVLRDVWSTALYRDPQILIGERILLALGVPIENLQSAKIYGAWREWRSRAIGWLVSKYPYPKLRRTADGKARTEATWTNLESELLDLWPLPAMPPQPAMTQEFLQRVYGWLQELDRHDRELYWYLRDPLSVRAMCNDMAIYDWEASTYVGIGCKSWMLEPKKSNRGRPRPKDKI